MSQVLKHEVEALKAVFPREFQLTIIIEGLEEFFRNAVGFLWVDSFVFN